MKRMLALVAVVVCLFGVLPPVWASPPPDPRLDQTVRSDEQHGKGSVELAQGHVDVGPKVVSGQWELMARDDTAVPPVWRDPDEVVLRVNDRALLAMPPDEQYQFMNLPEGAMVHVIPQTQNQQVVWLGWNTQDPAAASIMGRGAKLVLHRVQGPGAMHLFLQNGFDAPQPLWNSTQSGPQEMWMEVNSHTHANWLFSQPGVYLADVSVDAQGSDGRPMSAHATLRFAVGDSTSLDAARAAQWSEPPPSTGQAATPSASAGPAARDGLDMRMVGATGLGSLAVVGMVLFGVWRMVRSRRDRAEVYSEDGGEGHHG